MKNIQTEIQELANKYLAVKIISKKEAFRIGEYALEQNPKIAQNRDIYVNIQVDEYGDTDDYKYEICDLDEKPQFTFYAQFTIIHTIDRKILKLQYTHRSIEGDPEYFIDTVKPFLQIWKNTHDAIYQTTKKLSGKINPNYKSGDFISFNNQKYTNNDEIHNTTNDMMKELGYLKFSSGNIEITTIPTRWREVRIHVSVGFHDCGHDDTGDVCSNVVGFDFFFDRHI